MTPVSNTELGMEAEGAPNGELPLGQGSELTMENRETIAIKVVGQELL